MILPAENLAYLLKHDSVYGRAGFLVESAEGALMIDGKKVACITPDCPTSPSAPSVDEWNAMAEQEEITQQELDGILARHAETEAFLVSRGQGPPGCHVDRGRLLKELSRVQQLARQRRERINELVADIGSDK